MNYKFTKNIKSLLLRVLLILLVVGLGVFIDGICSGMSHSNMNNGMLSLTSDMGSCPFGSNCLTSTVIKIHNQFQPALSQLGSSMQLLSIALFIGFSTFLSISLFLLYTSYLIRYKDYFNKYLNFRHLDAIFFTLTKGILNPKLFY